MSEVKLWGWDCKCGGLPIPVTPVTEYQKLKSDYDALKDKLEKAEAVISFYASEDTWINKEFDGKNNLIGWTQKKPNDVSIFPYSIGNSNGNFHCLGSRAREYLKGEG